MNKLSITVEDMYYDPTEFISYMLNFNGIDSVEVKENTVNYIYDSKLIDINRIKLETLFFLGLNNIPSIVSFNKYEDGKKYQITIKDVCCEYCLKGRIEELLDNKGILSATTDFDYENLFNVHIDITYCTNKLTIEDLNSIEEKLNDY